MRSIKLVLLASFALLGVASQAQAELGGRGASVDADRVKLRATMSRSAEHGRTIHQLAAGDGTVTREFTTTDGTIFAVSWSGPQRPNLKQLFGDYYPRFQAVNAQTGKARMRRAMAVNDIDFVVQTGGRPGAFWGYAFLRSRVPSDFNMSTLTGAAQ